jgi:hypothetical protein
VPFAGIPHGLPTGIEKKGNDNEFDQKQFLDGRRKLMVNYLYP